MAKLFDEKAYKKQYYIDNKNKFLATAKTNYNPELKKIYDKEYNKLPEVRSRKNAQSVLWTIKNPKLRAKFSKKYYEANKASAFENSYERTRRIKLATPPWLTFKQRQEIKIFYASRPENFHVDHIVPLKGKNVSGLHVLWNLQYLPASENSRKGIKHE